MMVHHDNHHRPFTSPPSSSSKYGGDGDVVPAGTNGRFFSSSSGAAVVNGRLGLLGGGDRRAPHHHHRHHHDPFESFIPSASSSSGMGYPFTQAQWRELERQAMIYKYMVASAPVPPDLLFPLSSVPDSHYSSSLAGGSYSLRFGNAGGDPEPGRCRRTDGKKWRCSRAAAPDQKYCERHLNRGRPRSRKPVEVSASPNKKTRHCHGSNAPLPSSSPAAAGNNATPSQHYHNNQAPQMFLRGNGGLEPVSVPHSQEARGLEWLMIRESHIAEETLNLNSNYTSTKSNQFNEYLFPLGNSDVISVAEPQSSTPRGFIDAWSDTNSKKSCSVSPHDEKLSLSEEMGHIHMGLGVSHWVQAGDVKSSSWISSAPGGPLGEVFRPTINSVSSPSSLNSGSPLISSPSAVLQRKMTSISDSSGGSSPTPGSSMGRSEINVNWFNPN
ncbi:growth-regulating factor 1 [Punica granatum]|uniref:Growth-regulating factor 1 n=2 Tax=Punica granatum TaxID=22663 RepID=A0A6P8DDL6_PUNGR|nr:growth-regulating factor 1 [Punica granatum]PKI53902.1 hypothetical protein CRG98_025696 [Punica granatum]